MAIDALGYRTPDKKIAFFDEDDSRLLDNFHVNQPLRIRVAGSRKERSYRELCCYKGSCKYIANMDFNEDMNTQSKVDCLTKIQCGFVEGTVYDEKSKRTQWILRSLSYDNCDHPESHRFIASALEKHAAFVGIDNVEDYVRLLNDQK